MSDWNARTIEEFRANEGRVGGTFEGAPIVLLHHRGRTSGREYVTPVMYLPHDTDPDIIFVFATRSGAPISPDWYHNLTAAGGGVVERHADLRGDRPRCDRRRTRPHLRRTSAALPWLRRVRTPDRRRPHDPGARTEPELSG